MTRKLRDLVPNLLPGFDLTAYVRSELQKFDTTVRSEYLKTECFSKYVSSETDSPELRRSRAISKWLETESKNELTNERILTTCEAYQILPHVPFSKFISWCRDYIRDIIGDTPPIEALIGSFSGGASTSRSRIVSHPANKYVGLAHITEPCLLWWNLLSEELPGWLGQELCDLKHEVVRGNVLFTVPKKTDIDRVACKEPDLNMFIQKGIGNHFRNSLRRIGINLNDQSRNRSLAQLGSATGSLATLDLSSASDSVSTEFVALMLPEIWFSLLNCTRSQVTIIDGDEHQNHMFSSMGNGFTFELESLLFYVLGRATAYFTRTRGIVSVYGDDIICPTDMSQDFIWVLQYFGFSVNPDKSFTSGPFRESCGGHFHLGYEITPFYIKAPIENIIDIIAVANKLRWWLSDCGSMDPQGEPLWLFLKSLVPKCLWGGEDTSFKYQLVSLDTPSHRIFEDTQKRSTGIGGYFQWLNATWDRAHESDGISTSLRSTTCNRFRLRRVRNSAVPRLQAWFDHELGYVPDR